MSRNPAYQFISTDSDEIVAYLVAAYEKLTKTTVMPASPEKLFIQWVAYVIIQERALTNWTGNQNIPSRADGKNLDALAELFYEQTRPGERAAVCTMRFYVSEPQEWVILVPVGTRVSDEKKKLVWETTEDCYVPAGENYVDVKARCQTAGTVGNGYVPGQINKLVDIYEYYSQCENITETEGGTDVATDEEFYELIRASMDGYSTAGPTGGYIYHAMRVSTEIADVCANSPTPGIVWLYVLMDGGNPAGEEMKEKVYNECSPDNTRPFTDWVHMGDPVLVPYDIDLTYYIHENSPVSSAEMKKAVDDAVEEYIAWQYAKLGRDINPSKLYHLLMKTGIKRVDLRSPVFTPLRDGKLTMAAHYDNYEETVPQVARIRNVNVVNGGFEDE